MYLKKKILFTYQNIVILASLIPIVVFGFLTYNNSKDETTKTTFKYIQTITTQKKQLIQTYFKNLEFDSHELTKTISFLEKQAKNNIINIQTLQKKNIQDYYHAVENNIISLSKKDIFQYIYSFLHRGKSVNNVYFEDIKSYKKTLGLKNILMIDPSGKILYSSEQENLVGTYTKELSSSFNKIFSKLQSNKKSKEVHFINFSYEVISQQYKQYIITRFKDVDGFIAMEINQEELQKSIYNVASLGKSAETYLVYQDTNKTYLATNRYKKIGKLGDKKSGEHIDRGFNFQGVDIKYGSTGNIELLGYRPIKIKNIVLSMQTTVAYTDIISPIIKGTDYFEQFVKDHDFHNLMIIGQKGDIFYSISKKDDYKTNIFTGKYSDTHLRKAVDKVFKTKKFVLSDFDFYGACSDTLAQFALSPILKSDGDVQSIVVIQLKVDYLSKLLIDNSNLYKSYETYVVGKDAKLRSDTRLSPNIYNVQNSYKNNIHIETNALDYVFNIGNSTDILTDYRGKKVLSSFNLIDSHNLQWAIISEIDASEVEDMLSSLKYNIFLFVLISSIIALFVMVIITNEKKKQDKKLYHTATHDALTGLPNRKFALEFLSYILANSKRLQTKGAVLFIDLDKFKFINDSYGHKAGDFVLIEIALRLQNLLRNEDLIARLGGDEFILIINNFQNNHDLETLCKKIITTIGKPISDADRTYQVGISIGIAIFPNDSDKAEELLQFSDTAMFKTKDNGRNGFTYYSKELTEKFLTITRIQSELKHAIKNNELVLHFQPQIKLSTSKVIGVEVLVRWNHPRDGLVMPNDFIPIAEESDLIIELGYWVTREACKKFQEWQKAGCSLEYIAINMSTKQLQCNKCVDNIQKTLKDLNFDPSYLELEITENTLITNLNTTLTNINLLKKIGVRFSIDDFGTGYSSLSYLKSLQISTLKIDREFIKDIIADKDDRTIVEAMIVMGHTLDYTIVAEGAESKEEVILLKCLACDIIQGYYYSKPLPEKELLKFIQEFKIEDTYVKR